MYKQFIDYICDVISHWIWTKCRKNSSYNHPYNLNDSNDEKAPVDEKGHLCVCRPRHLLGPRPLLPLPMPAVLERDGRE